MRHHAQAATVEHTAARLLPRSSRAFGDGAHVGRLTNRGAAIDDGGKGSSALQIDPHRDVYEREADRVARTATAPMTARSASTPRGRPAIQELSRTAAGNPVSPEVQSAIEHARGGGDRLNPSVRQIMERALGADFGAVRVHQGPQADRLNKTLNSIAFTSGTDVFFRAGADIPGSPHGRALLAHELTHVVQQRRHPALQRAVSSVELSEKSGPELKPIEGLGALGIWFHHAVTVKVDGQTSVEDVRLRRRVRIERWQTDIKTEDKVRAFTDGSRTNVYDKRGVRVVPQNAGSPTTAGLGQPKWQDDGPSERESSVFAHSESGRVTREKGTNTIVAKDSPGGFRVTDPDGNPTLRNPGLYVAEFEFVAEELGSLGELTTGAHGTGAASGMERPVLSSRGIRYAHAYVNWVAFNQLIDQAKQKVAEPTQRKTVPEAQEGKKPPPRNVEFRDDSRGSKKPPEHKRSGSQ